MLYSTNPTTINSACETTLVTVIYYTLTFWKVMFDFDEMEIIGNLIDSFATKPGEISGSYRDGAAKASLKNIQRKYNCKVERATRRQQDDYEFERQLAYKRLRVRRWLRHPEFGQEQVPENPDFDAPTSDEHDESQPGPSTASSSRTNAQQQIESPQNAPPQDQQLPNRAPVIATTVNSHHNVAWVPRRNNIPPEIDRAITEMVALEAERARQSLRDHRQTTEENRERHFQRLADCARVEELMFETRQGGPEIEEYMQWLDNFLANDRRRRDGPAPEN